MLSALPFRELKVSENLQQTLAELGFATMTEIQARAIPPVLEGQDLIGQSKTGSGKTLAFALPLLDRIRLVGRRPQGLILCPTRELCTQVAREIRRLGRRSPGLQVLVLSGGEPIRHQLKGLEAGAQILVATPGRMKDHLERETIDLAGLRMVVLDEADRMLDMGFQADIETILAATPKNRQTLLFSATFPSEIEGLSQRFLRQPLRVSVEGSVETTAKIEQHLVELAREQKLEHLHSLFDVYRPEAAIVFANHRASIGELCEALKGWGVAAAGLHGELEQLERDRVLARLRNRSIRVLVATDVAARGIDISDIDLVVNYDIPVKPEVYVHRIGRTGRAGQAGQAFTFASPREAHKIEAIEEYTKVPMERTRLPVTKNAAPAREELSQKAAMTTISIGGGRKDKLRPGDILGALTGEAGGLQSYDVGKIEIFDRIAYVAVAQRVGRHAVECLRGGRIKGRKFTVEWLR